MQYNSLNVYQQIIHNELNKHQIEDCQTEIYFDNEIRVKYVPTDTQLFVIYFKNYKYILDIGSNLVDFCSSNLEVFREYIEASIFDTILPYIEERENSLMEATCKLCKELTGPSHHSGCGYNCYENPACAWHNKGNSRNYQETVDTLNNLSESEIGLKRIVTGQDLLDEITKKGVPVELLTQFITNYTTKRKIPYVPPKDRTVLNDGVERKSEPLKEGSTKSNIKINPTEKNHPSISKDCIAPPPPSKPKPPITRIIQEGCLDDCPSCKSSRVRKYLTGSLLQFGDYLGCINPNCENYYIKTI